MCYHEWENCTVVEKNKTGGLIMFKGQTCKNCPKDKNLSRVIPYPSLFERFEIDGKTEA